MKHVQPATVTIAACALLAVVVLASPVIEAADTAPAAAAPRVRPSAAQNTYASPEEAAKALADAIRADDRKQIWRVLGPGASKFVRSGDPVQDNDARVAFVAAYDRSVKFERAGDTKATLVIGADDFPFPYPLVKKNERWQFDAKQGNEQVLDRRIGRNELSAIKVCLAYADAQREYATLDRDGNGLLEYAQQLASTPGSHDGLYWETNEGDPPSPLGLLAASARSQGYGRQGPAAPYHGYFYKILSGQGRNADGGAYDYVVNGKMIGGFGLVAYPARWGNSGVMSFMCNHEGVVYEKNLGQDTQAVASKMTLFDPDPCHG
ncbi:MAG TPA: DUF2950 domain-containing protein, partial [Casimicrobiaceae bacterium]